MVERAVRLPARPAPMGGLDYHGGEGEAGHRRVAHREGLAARRRVRPELGDHGVASLERLLEACVLWWVGVREPGADDRHRATTGGEGGGVGRRVDPGGEPRDHGVPVLDQVLDDAPCPRERRWCGAAGTDHRHRPGVFLAQQAGEEDQRRPIVDRAKVLRIVGVEDSDQPEALPAPAGDVGGSGVEERLHRLIVKERRRVVSCPPFLLEDCQRAASLLGERGANVGCSTRRAEQRYQGCGLCLARRHPGEARPPFRRWLSQLRRRVRAAR